VRREGGATRRGGLCEGSDRGLVGDEPLRLHARVARHLPHPRRDRRPVRRPHHRLVPHRPCEAARARLRAARCAVSAQRQLLAGLAHCAASRRQLRWCSARGLHTWPLAM